MKRMLTISLIGLSLALPAFASHSSTQSADWWSPSRLYLGAYGGYTNVNGGYQKDGHVNQGRLALGLRLTENKLAVLGAEVGIQSGNDMRLQVDQDLLGVNSAPINATLKPLADFLLTLKYPSAERYPIFATLKGGIAYRQLQLNEITSIRDSVRKISPELQLGLGWTVTKNATLTALYQGIYAGSTAGISSDSNNDFTVSRIPTQQAVFIGIEYSFGGLTDSTPNTVMPTSHASSHMTNKHTARNRYATAPRVQPMKTATYPIHQYKPEPNTEGHRAIAHAKKATSIKKPAKKLAQTKPASKPTTKKITGHKLAATKKTSTKKSSANLVSKSSSKKSGSTKKIASKKAATKKTSSVTLAKATKKTATKIAKHKKPNKTLAAKPSKPKQVEPKQQAPQALARADDFIIEQPGLDFSLMSDNEVNITEKQRPHSATEVLV